MIESSPSALAGADSFAAGCDDFATSVSRRTAIRSALGIGLGLVAASVFGDAFVETAYASGGKKADRVLVVLSLRGAADGLSLVVPHADPIYYAARPNIAVPKDKLLAGDSQFGLHPAFAPILPLWKAGRVAAIHATGQAVTTRSHFAAMEEVEDADPGSQARVGWLNRLVSVRAGGASDTTALQLGETVLATQLAGPAPAVSTAGLAKLKLVGPGGSDAAGWEAALTGLWADAPDAVAGGGGRALAVAKSYATARDATASTVEYPKGSLGEALQGAAKVIKADVGAEVITIDQGSWDHHQWVGNLSSGNLKNMADPLGKGLAAFFSDLGAMDKKVTLVTISEFGRRVKENGNGGLDHGHGNVMFVLGAGVKGGYYGRWPGLENTQNADLAVTTDYRDVLSEVVGSLYPERSLATIFPQFQHRKLGFMAPVVTGGDTGPSTPTLKTMPSSFFSSYGKRAGSSRVGSKVTAPAPTLTSAGKKAKVKTSYRWETVKNGTVKKRGTLRSFRIPTSYRGYGLRVRVTYTAKGYKPKTKVFTWGTVKSKK
ncbi:DUF1501 domain-containing protein [Microbacterium sp. LjRoot45]|uniref:DUF1501 domain-containing protein n=1 Tax=Microbacterium sp. LjRoot45 TaxID=3342329 RepID=UPI003ECF3B56